MPMASAAYICGYDPATEALVLEVALPASLQTARRLAGVPDTDPDLADAYPLSQAAVAALFPSLPLGLAYFLEAFAGEQDG